LAQRAARADESIPRALEGSFPLWTVVIGIVAKIETFSIFFKEEEQQLVVGCAVARPQRRPFTDDLVTGTIGSSPPSEQPRTYAAPKTGPSAMIALIDLADVSQGDQHVSVALAVSNTSKLRASDGGDHLTKLVRACRLLANIAVVRVVPCEQLWCLGLRHPARCTTPVDNVEGTKGPTTFRRWGCTLASPVWLT
jgi:hypothetical protein